MRQSQVVTKHRIFTLKAIANQDSYNSDLFPMQYGEDFSYIAIVTGTADLKLEYQMTESVEGDPVNVSSAHDGNAIWITPTTGGVIVSNLTANKANGFAPALSKWGRFTATGNAGNTAAVLTLIILSR